MSRLVSRLKTAHALGATNILRVLGYRLGVRVGWNPVRRLEAERPRGPFLAPVDTWASAPPPRRAWQGSGQLFSYRSVDLAGRMPDWLAHPLTGRRPAHADRPWWQIPDFDPEVGDIKLIWEFSRMDWALAFAQQARAGDSEVLVQLNAWLDDWCRANPPYLGPNWKCGQEASIRVMHLAIAALILGQVHRPLPGLVDLVRVHLRRIAPTLQYAIAQDNNHGTSEAAALFMGGSWLAALGHKDGLCWQGMGRRWLENRVARLIGPQGSFSQYSLNYHRVMLDTLSMTEVWRRHLALPAFSDAWYQRAGAAAQWLRHMANPLNGDGPNVGANDGARLLQLTDSDYRDHRPSVQLAMALFLGQRAYAQAGPWDDVLAWLGVAPPVEDAAPLGDYVADDGGFAVLRRGQAMAMLRYPRFRFRPSHADALHLDLWLGAVNVLRDGGTYSYNTEPAWLEYFPGTASHNTIQFDGRDQMPRLGRFLFGDWLRTQGFKPLSVDGRDVHFAAGYRYTRGAQHHRAICLAHSRLRVTDDVSGFAQKAVLRWRLAPGDWDLHADGATQRLVSRDNPALQLSLQATMPMVRCELVEGWESRHYLERTALPVLELEVHQSGRLTTEILWQAG